MKKIIFVIIIILLVFLIYIGLQDKKIYYVALGDDLIKGKINDKENYDYHSELTKYLEDKNKLEKYINYSFNNYKVPDIMRNINDNINIDNKTIKNILIKADVLTISFGNTEIQEKIKLYNKYELNRYINSYINDLEQLLLLIRQYCKEDIIYIGYYNSIDDNDIIKYLNERVKKICNNNNIYFLDISNFSTNNLYLSKNDYSIISNQIKKYIIENVID